jgi:hypothetical protein
MAVARLMVNRANKSCNTEGDVTDTNGGAEGEGGEPAMTEMQQACLLFCIELLNQTTDNSEYDLALVCGSVVLGVNPSGREAPSGAHPAFHIGLSVLSGPLKAA